MAMLSRLLRFRVVDRAGRRGRVADLAVDLAVGDYPLVDRLLVRNHRSRQAGLPWAAVEAVDWRRGRLAVADLEAAQPLPQEALERLVLLERDVLDALVLDLARRQATRANDLWLFEEGGRLRLMGADLSPWAIVRRLGRGLLGRGGDRNLLDWKEVEFLRGDPRAARAGNDYHRRVTRLQPAEIARLVDALPYLHAAELLTLIDDAVAADALESMSPERQTQIFEELDNDQALRLLELMAPNVAANLLGGADPSLAERLLNQLSDRGRQRLIELLRYPGDTAGGIMTNDVVSVELGCNVGEAREQLREQLAGPDFVYYVYVVEGQTRLLRGLLTLRDLLLADVDRPIAEVMERRVESIDPLEPASSAARQVADKHLAALPVVARDGRLLGAITVDAALAQVAPASWREQAPRVFS